MINRQFRQIVHPASGQSLQARVGVVATFLWASGTVPLLVAFALLLLVLAYQTPLRLQRSLAVGPAPLQLLDTYPAERTEWEGYDWQRWTRLTASVVVPDAGGRAATVRLRFFGGSPAGERTLRISSGDYLLADVPVRAAWQDVYLPIPRNAARHWSGDLIIDLEVSALEITGDRRELGIALHEIELVPHSGPTLPPISSLLMLPSISLLVLWALRLMGLPVRWSAAGAGLVVLLLALALAGWLSNVGPTHLHGLVSLPAALATAALTFVLAALLLASTWRWGWREAPAWAIVLRCSVLLIFALRVSGMLHPAFDHIDHRLRANQLLAIANGQAAAILPGLEQQYEWGTREPIPYSLFTYYVLVPLVWIWDGSPSPLLSNNQILVAIKSAMSLFDASVPLLLWALLRGTPGHNSIAAWAGLCYAAMPIGYLYFHDGSFPTTIGLWAVLLALVAVRAWSEQSRGWLEWGVLVALLAVGLVAYVTHIAFFSLLILGLLASMWFFGTPAQRRNARWIGGAFGVALLLVWVIYYSRYTMVLLQQTIPAFLAILLDEGEVGRDAEAFFGKPPHTFASHMIAHFRVWPPIVAAAALGGFLLRRRQQFVTHLGLAYLIFFIVSELVDQWFGLWNKHMYFAYPAVALLCGAGLRWLWRRGWAGRGVCLGLLAYLFWASLIAWSFRIFWFDAPLALF